MRLVSVVDFVPLLSDPLIRMPDWYFDASAGGGWLGASGSHAIDMIRLWLGEFDRVSATTSVASADARGDADDSFVLHFGLRSGAAGVIQQTGAAFASAGQTVISGTRGTVRVQGGQVVLADAEGRRTLHPVGDDGERGSDGAPERPTQLESMTSHETAAYIQLCDAFARAIRGDAPSGDVPLPTFADGVAAMDVMDAARQSAASRGALVRVGGDGRY